MMNDNSKIILKEKKQDNLNVYKKGEHLENPNINAKTNIKKNIQRHKIGENILIKKDIKDRKKTN